LSKTRAFIRQIKDVLTILPPIHPRQTATMKPTTTLSLQFAGDKAAPSPWVGFRNDSIPQDATLKSGVVVGKLTGLRTELIDLAYVLERRGRPEAADVAMTISARLQEICDELAPPPPACVQPLIVRFDQ